MKPQDRIKQYKKECEKLLNEHIEIVNKSHKESHNKLNELEFVRFDNKNVYEGSIKNKIFFTHSNHYKGNAGERMSVNSLHKPHVSYEDRGYIKGVAVDLYNYTILRSLYNIDTNINIMLNIKKPEFKNTKCQEMYYKICDEIRCNTQDKADTKTKEYINYLDEYTKYLTGCTLRYYLETI